MTAKRRMVKITKEMAKVQIPGTELTVADVTTLENIVDQGEGRGSRWAIYRLPDGDRLDVSESYMNTWKRISVMPNTDNEIISAPIVLWKVE